MTDVSERREVLPLALYMMPGCGVCHQVKQFLARRRVEVELRWLSEPELATWAQAYADRTGNARAPFLVAGETVVQGYDPEAITALVEASGHTVFEPEAGTTRPVPTGNLGLPAAALWVTNFLAESISFLHPRTGAVVAPPLPLGEGTLPIAVAHDPDTELVVVSDFAQHRLLLLDRSTGTWRHGELEASVLPVAGQPADIALDRRRRRMYVGCVRDGLLVAVDSVTGGYAFGTLEASSLAVGQQCGNLVVDPVLDRAFVRNELGVVAVDLERFALIGGSRVAEASIVLGMGRNVSVHPERHLLHVPLTDGSVVYLDGRDGSFAFGDRSSSSLTGLHAPFTTVVDAEQDVLYLSCLGTEDLTTWDATAPRPSPTRTDPLPVGAAARSMTVRGSDRVLAVSAFDDGVVTFVDMRTNTYALGGRARSTAPVGRGPRGMAYVEPN